jgi:hypothetical protein
VVRQRAEEEVLSLHREELAALKAECEARVAEVQESEKQARHARVRDGLLRLAGLGAARPRGSSGEGE